MKFNNFYSVNYYLKKKIVDFESTLFFSLLNFVAAASYFSISDFLFQYPFFSVSKKIILKKRKQIIYYLFHQYMLMSGKMTKSCAARKKIESQCRPEFLVLFQYSVSPLLMECFQCLQILREGYFEQITYTHGFILILNFIHHWTQSNYCS